MKVDRQRKTKNPCLGCRLHLDRCICAQIPKLILRTRVTLIVHAKELKRTTNTGTLALRALTNSAMCVRGFEHDRLDLHKILDPTFDTVLLYPSATSTELTRPVNDKPLHILVPDGNWRQASKVAQRHPELSNVPRVHLHRPQEASTARLGSLRVEHMQHGMATLEAIAYALEIVEGDLVGQALLNLYHAKLSATLEGRGQPGLEFN